MQVQVCHSLVCVCLPVHVRVGVWSLQMCKTAPNLSQRHLPVFFAGLLNRHTTGSKR